MPQNLIGWVDVPVKDLDRASAFYAAVLDAKIPRQKMGDFEFGLLPHAGEGASGCLAPMEHNEPSRTGPLIYLSVDGRLDAAAEAVAAHGGEVLQPKHPIGPYGFRTVIVDSEGNRVALHSPTA